MAQSSRTRNGILTVLEGRDCNFCESGELVREQYKGSRAVVCRSCQVPTVRLSE